MAIKPSTSYEAYCLECNGGGKTLSRSSKRDAEKACTSHINAYGHKVTIVYKGGQS